MNILFLSNAYPDFDSSYRGIFVKKMATLLRDEGYSIAVVTPKVYNKSHYFEEQGGIKVYRFPFLARDKLLIEYRKIPYLRMVIYYISGFFVTLYAVLKNRCDLIHVHWAIPTGLIGVWVGKLLRKPFIVTIHGSDFRMATERFGFLTKIFLSVCQRANQIMCVSEVQKNEIERIGVKPEKVSTIPMGIDETFLEAGRKRRKKSNGESHMVLSNRNLLPLYNVSLLIRAIPKIIKEQPHTKFLIAGDGSDRKDLETEAGRLNVGSSVQFLGRLPHEKMAELLSEADIYVSTSLSDGTSVSLLEAMGSGAFPIVTDIPANREWVVDGKNGFLVPVDQAEILANRILNAIHDRDLLEKSRVENFLIAEKKAFWPANIRRLEGIYSSVLSNVAQ